MIRQIVKRFFPGLYNYIRMHAAFRLLRNAYSYDIKRYFEYSDYFFNDSEHKCVMRIMHRSHPIEKGLCMPEMKLGFGGENISQLIEDCIEYRSRYLSVASQNNSDGYQQYKHAIGTLLEYRQYHLDAGYNLDSDLLQSIDLLAEGTDDFEICKQIETTKEKYFENIYSSFGRFSASRHSLRNFVGKVKDEDIFAAIEIAQNSPSACNRQPTRVHVVGSQDLKSGILELQGGNRGFGHLADKVLIVSVELFGYRGISERNGLFVDGGLFAMNLIYALHSYKIGTCALNWSCSPEKDILLRDIIQIPKSQTVIMMIACGGVPDNFKLTYSKRNGTKTVVFQHTQ
jgi:nitroreductase